MILRGFLFSIFFSNTLCFMWLQECEVIPTSGCTCMGDDSYRHVTCSYLGLTDVPQLSKVTHMELLDLSYNRFLLVIGNCFGNGVVKNLVLTNNGGRLNFDVCALTYEQKVSISHLKLSNNGLIKVPSMIINMTNLVSLDLSENEIQYIDSQDFSRLFSLRRLELKGNKIKEVEPVFYNTSGLREISLTFNSRVVSITKDITGVLGEYNMAFIKLFVTKLVLESFPLRNASFLRSLWNLESLRISGCSLKDKHLRPKGRSLLYGSKGVIRYVDLSHNVLETIPNKMLYGCTKLLHLDLSSNYIEQLNYLPHNYPELEYLDLSDNVITSLRTDWKNWKLKHLDLSNNYIMYIESDVFKYAYTLEFLDLSGNNLPSIPRASFPAEFPTSLTINIRNNPLKCDTGCDMQWLVLSIWKQSVTGIGPFSLYDVYNTMCTDMYGVRMSLLDLYNTSFKSLFHCELE